MATGKFKTLHGNSDLQGSWEQLVADLNKMAKDGKSKDVKSWKSVNNIIFCLKKIYVVLLYYFMNNYKLNIYFKNN